MWPIKPLAEWWELVTVSFKRGIWYAIVYRYSEDSFIYAEYSTRQQYMDIDMMIMSVLVYMHDTRSNAKQMALTLE